MKLLLIAAFWFIALGCFLGVSLDLLKLHKPEPISLGFALFVAGFIVQLLYDKFAGEG